MWQFRLHLLRFLEIVLCRLGTDQDLFAATSTFFMNPIGPRVHNCKHVKRWTKLHLHAQRKISIINLRTYNSTENNIITWLTRGAGANPPGLTWVIIVMCVLDESDGRGCMICAASTTEALTKLRFTGAAGCSTALYVRKYRVSYVQLKIVMQIYQYAYQLKLSFNEYKP